mmetsp:Transcript_14034/g.24638  ORF Transcript_14034/g.24638 Transcript_14034/m.24638 type:complete len:566 (-) Transcript_14034:202-1899(-)
MAMSLYLLLVLGCGSILAEGKEHYWGNCDKWDRDRNGCAISSGEKCSDHLSPGPKKATLEMVIGNLPPSTPEVPVHLHFFAAREALGYNPVEGPHMHTIYRSPRHAYPFYTDPDFNGGNVRVNETGHAVLRLMAPSTYVVCQNRIRWPHLKLRLCTGENFTTYRVESIDFTYWGPKVRACSVKDESKLYKVHSFNRTDVPIPQIPNEMVAVAAETTEKATTTPETTTEKVTTTEKITTTEKVTTTIVTSIEEITTTFQTSTTEKVIADATLSMSEEIDDSYDWDALEYSPVYQCLTDSLVYNHFTSECSKTCPADSDLKHGQCVRQDKMQQDVEFNMSWELKVYCDEECWSNKKGRSLHMLRLAVADHLDIPFQEVLKVVLRPVAHEHTHRRLDNHFTGATLFIGVTSGRIDAEKGQELLRTFLNDKTSASQLLGLEVHNLVIVDKKVTTLVEVDDAEASDEYSQFYKDYEPQDARGSGLSTIPGSPEDVFPAGVVVGVAAAVVVLGILTAVGLWYKKRMQQKNVQGKNVVEAVKVGAEDSKLPEEKGKFPEEKGKLPEEKVLAV